MTSSPSPLILRRHLPSAVWWSLLGALLVAAGAYFVVDSGGHVLAWSVLGVFALVALHFFLQLAVPGALVLRLGPDGLHARRLWRSVDVAWEDVQLVRVRRYFGDPVLVVDRHDGTRVRVPLPLGTDLDAVHRFLAARLGRPDDRQPGTDAATSSAHTGGRDDDT